MLPHPRHRRAAVVLAMAVLVNAAPTRADALGPIGRERLRQVGRRGPEVLSNASVNALERRLLADGADRRLDDHTLLEAALIAGGVDCRAELRRWVTRRAELLAEFRRHWQHVLAGGPSVAARQPRKPGSVSPRLLKADDTPLLAAELFHFMHRRVFDGGYRLAATDPRDALGNGRYNCVSASVLYKSLGEAVGLKITALAMPGHVLARVHLPDSETIDVETTCPSWFRRVPPASRQRRPREASPVDLAAMIYYNRGVALLDEGRFAEAAIANAKALRLDPQNPVARGNLLATLNNWAIALGEAGKFAAAVSVIEAGLAIDRDYETFALNYVHVHHQWTRRLVAQRRFDEALDHLRRAAETMPDRPYLHEAQAQVQRRRAALRRGLDGT